MQALGNHIERQGHMILVGSSVYKFEANKCVQPDIIVEGLSKRTKL